MKKLIAKIKIFIQDLLIDLFFSKYFRQLNEQSIAIDCGANLGGITERLAKTGATVYAFEPNPHAFKMLTNRVGGSKNVRCIQKGVWDKNATAKLYFHQNSEGDEAFWAFGSSIFETKNNVDKERFEEVELVDLTQFIIDLDQEVDFLKIDVEGAELDILKKFIELDLHQKVKAVFVEIHPKKIPGQKEALNSIRNSLKEKNIHNINLSWV